MRLTQKVAIVTGGGSGIGRATSLRFAEEGAVVVVADLDEAAARGVASEIAESGARAIACRTDITSSDDCRQAVEAAVSEFGGLDILVNNAGIEIGGTVVSTSEEEWDRELAVNLKGGFLMSKHAVPELRRRGGGVILFTASAAGLGGCTGQVAYAAGKAGVINLAKSMALDHARHNIRVNCICPSGTRTPLATRLVDEAGPEMQAAMDMMLNLTIPLGGRLAEPSEQADAFVFLASDDARFVTGQALAVDGGHTAGRMFILELVEP